MFRAGMCERFTSALRPRQAGPERPRIGHADVGTKDGRRKVICDLLRRGVMGEDHAAGTATRAGVGRPRGRGRLILSVSHGLNTTLAYTL